VGYVIDPVRFFFFDRIFSDFLNLPGVSVVLLTWIPLSGRGWPTTTVFLSAEI
jgi:hypothetical protein